MSQPAASQATGPRDGELLFVGFDGTAVDVGVRAFLREVRPGGIILFQRNIAEPHQVIGLLSELRALYEPGPILALDEEGGRVSRLQPVAPTLPAAARLAALRDPGAVREMAAALGRVLASLGFDLDFAPVVDLCSQEAPNGIGDRSFGTDPRAVTSLAEAFLAGLAEAGVAGCLKHFPGLGPALCDSHHDLPTVGKEAAAFLAEDVEPYRRLHDRAPVIMIGHGHYPFLAGAAPLAATLAPSVATDLLRRDVGFSGLALADDLEMKAVWGRVPPRDLAPRALAAGCDMVLVCHSRDAMISSRDAIGAWRQRGRLQERRFLEAAARLGALRRRAAAARVRAHRGLEAFRSARADLDRRLRALA